MTSEQAAQLIDDTLDLVHQRLVVLEQNQHFSKRTAGRRRRARGGRSRAAAGQGTYCMRTNIPIPGQTVAWPPACT